MDEISSSENNPPFWTPYCKLLLDNDFPIDVIERDRLYGIPLCPMIVGEDLLAHSRWFDRQALPGWNVHILHPTWCTINIFLPCCRVYWIIRIRVFRFLSLFSPLWEVSSTQRRAMDGKKNGVAGFNPSF
jgi:hypothetical protein